MRQARSQRDEQIEKKFGEIATAYLYWIDTDVLNYNWWIYWLHIQPKKNIQSITSSLYKAIFGCSRFFFVFYFYSFFFHLYS